MKTTSSDMDAFSVRQNFSGVDLQGVLKGRFELTSEVFVRDEDDEIKRGRRLD